MFMGNVRKDAIVPWMVWVMIFFQEIKLICRIEAEQKNKNGNNTWFLFAVFFEVFGRGKPFFRDLVKKLQGMEIPWESKSAINSMVG